MIKIFSDWLVYGLIKLKQGTLLAEALNFFVYDTIKIFILLSVVIFIVAIVRTFLNPDKIRQILAHKNKYLGHFLAGILGIFTPFCTCSAIPLFLGFIEVGVPLGVTFTFLVASPMINEFALALLLSMFGIKVAIIYVISGLFIAIISGLIIGAIHSDKLLEKIAQSNYSKSVFTSSSFNWISRLTYARDYTLGIIKSIWIFVFLGIGVGAWMHGYITADFLAKYAGHDKWYAVPLVVLIGIPLYGSCA